MPDKNNLLHVRFGSAGTHTVNSPPNIQVWGLHIPQKGTTIHYSDGTRQRLTVGPIPSSDGCKP
jgi:hypothetical protein